MLGSSWEEAAFETPCLARGFFVVVHHGSFMVRARFRVLSRLQVSDVLRSQKVPGESWGCSFHRASARDSDILRAREGSGQSSLERFGQVPTEDS